MRHLNVIETHEHVGDGTKARPNANSVPCRQQEADLGRGVDAIWTMRVDAKLKNSVVDPERCFRRF
jgi:hypothetical protein